jgi:protein-tyrosine phosphatase
MVEKVLLIRDNLTFKLGRTGTVVVCCLVVMGHTVKEAIQITREARPGTIRNPLQLFYVHQFALRWRELIQQRTELT